MMSEQAHEASNIVEDLLVAARSDPSQLRLALESTDLRPHIEYALASLPKADLPRIKWSGISQVVEADTTRLRQIVRNLLENAVRYGGPEIEIRAWREEATVWLSVSDNGVGLTSRDLKRIFEPYERSDQAETESPTGVGIGLYVSRLLARLMGGELDCVRPSGRTVFRLQLPAATAPALEPLRDRVAS
jgi:signal transduction histidine kinase